MYEWRDAIVPRFQVENSTASPRGRRHIARLVGKPLD
jgi:hypothetical protein